MDTLQISASILAQSIHELNPSRSIEEWQEYINKNGNDPKAFFGNNKQGLEEYENFCRTYDKDNHNRKMKRKRGN